MTGAALVSIEMIADVVLLQDKLEKMHVDAKSKGPRTEP